MSQPVLAPSQPLPRDDALGPLGLELRIKDRAAGGELHRKAGVVLVIDDRVARAREPRLAGDDRTSVTMPGVRRTT